MRVLAAVRSIGEPRGQQMTTGSLRRIAALFAIVLSTALSPLRASASHDSIGQRLFESNDAFPLAIAHSYKTKGALPNTITFEHDSLGQRLSESNDALPLAVAHSYNTAGQPATTLIGPQNGNAAAIFKTYDDLYRLKTVTLNVNRLARFDYQGIGGPTAISYDSGAKASLTYDLHNHQTGIAVALNQSLLASEQESFGSDLVPRMRQRTFNNGAPTTDVFQADLAGRTRQGQLARPFTGSPLTIQEIMAAGRPIADPGGVAGALRWDVPGTLHGAEGTWELVLDPQSNTILHFNFR